MGVVDLSERYALLLAASRQKCKQPKKSISLRQVNDALYEVEQEFYIIKHFNDFKTDLKGASGNTQQLNVQPLNDVEAF
jgi:hypothetical protein